ncbi:endonuclease domain-containing protein [Micromonospora sp. LOL_023]|uniref:endonuclease domain-containing protein n=1 Tax=Micromonospora sp. LOL_023 TaxID=3345418 RepID=UPI003A857BDA
MSRPATVPRELSFEPFSASRAIAAGLITRRMLNGPSWRRILPDVYVHKSSYDPDDHRMWCRAAAARLPPGAAIHELSAAFLWGVDILPRRGPGQAVVPVHVALPKTARRYSHPILKSAHRTLAPDDITSFAGLPLTTGVRTAFDLGRSLPRAAALGALDTVLRRRLVTRKHLAAYIDTRPGLRGLQQVRELLALAEPLSESPMESRLRLLLHDAGLPKPIPQYEVRDAPLGGKGRFIARVDLAYPQWRIAIEYEGDHHRERATFRKDVYRFNALREAGWLALRFTADDVLRRKGQVVRKVRDAIAERAT